MRFILVFILALPVLSQSSLDTAKKSLNELSNENLILLSHDIGKMCEFTAATLVAASYDSKNFFLVQNLTYGKSRRKLTGELDIIVFSRKTEQAIKLYEVKCRSDEEDAYEEAVKQLKRFQITVERCLRNRQAISITDGFQNYPCSKFEDMQYSVLMPKQPYSQSQAEHFDLSLEQVYQLQNFSKSILAMRSSAF